MKLQHENLEMRKTGGGVVPKSEFDALWEAKNISAERVNNLLQQLQDLKTQQHKSIKKEPLSDEAKEHEFQIKILQDLVESLGQEKENILKEAKEREEQLVAKLENARAEVVAKSKLLDETEARVDDVTKQLVKHLRQCNIAQLYKTTKLLDPSEAQTTFAKTTPFNDQDDKSSS